MRLLEKVENINNLRTTFENDGVVCVRKALDTKALTHAEHAYCWSLANPGPNARDVLTGVTGSFYQDHANPAAFPIYRPLLCETILAQLVADIMGSKVLWLLYEQIWLKEGGEKKRTPWHQDLSYVPMSGNHLATLWINLDPVEKVDSLEFIPSSHLGPLFNPTAFDAKNPSATMFKPGVWPVLPDIESKRDLFNIVSWDIELGDIIMFHPGILHGGAATRQGSRRRTISLRFFGDNSFCAERPETGTFEIDRLKQEGSTDPIKQLAFLKTGTLFRHSAFNKLL